MDLKIDFNFYRTRVVEVMDTYPPPTEKMKTCLDVGSNVGAFSLIFSNYCDKVIAVEPFKENYDFMMSKIEYYDVKNIIPINKALHTESGKVLEMKVLTEGTDSKDVTCNELKDFKWELMEKGVVNLGTVETISLNDIIKEHGEIDYMKVDCEGCEWDLLYEKDLSKVKAIVTEIHGGYMGEDKKEKLINYLTSEFGNKYVYHEEYKYRKNEQGKYVDPNLASSGDHEFIFHRDGTPDLKENLYIRFRVMNPNYGTNPVEYPDIYKNFVSHIKKYVIP